MFNPRVLFLILFCSLTGCLSAPDAARTIAQPSSSDTFKVVTYNTLHGLEVSKFWVRPGRVLIFEFHMSVSPLENRGL